MTSASAKVIIDAEDLASKKIADAARAIEQNVKNIKDVGGKAKASTEFIGTLATALGGSEIGSYAGQLAQLTDRVSQFSEVSKAGAAGALAFKAGLVAAVGAIAFKAGESLGNVIFQTRQMTREFERAKDAAEDLNAELAKSRDTAFANQKEDIDLIRDPKEKRAAQEELFKQLDNDVQGITQQLKDSTKTADEWAAAWKITGDRKAYAEEAEKQIEIDKARLEQAKSMRDELRRELSDRKAINDQIKANNEAAIKAEQEAAAAEKAKTDSSDAYLESLSKQLGLLEAAAAGKEALFGETAAQSTYGDAAQVEAEQLLAQIDLLKEKAELEKKAASEELSKIARSDSYLESLSKQLGLLEATAAGKEAVYGETASQNVFGDAAQFEAEQLLAQIDLLKEKADLEKKAVDDAQRLEEIKKNEIARLKEQRIEIEQGKEAARAFNLEQQGLDKATAQRLSREQAGLEELRKSKSGVQQQFGLQAVESRLLTRGRSEDSNAKIADNTKAALKELEKLNRREELKTIKNDQQFVLEVVGA